MKAKNAFIGLFVVLTLVFSLLVAGCDSGSDTGEVDTGDDGIPDDRPIVSYTATKNNVAYTLETGPFNAKAVHLPGDFYTLTVKKGADEKDSAGTVVDFDANVFTLQPSDKDAPTFKVTISGTKITNISGTITYADGSTENGPGTFSTGGGGGGGGGGIVSESAPSITTSSLLGGVVGTAYSQTLVASGTEPITWSIDSGSLPAGLTLSGAVISGTPSAIGSSSFTVKAANSAGSDTKALSIAIAAATGTPDTAWYGAGSASAFTLTDADELAGLAQLVNSGNDFSGKTITLSSNLNLSVYPDWTPIGTFSDQFLGTFDGGGKTVANLTITGSIDWSGLFGIIGTGSVVKNLILKVNISSTASSVGSVAGLNLGTLENCYSTGNVKGGNTVGGVAGRSDGTVENCYSTGSVTSTSSNVGGVAGGNYGTVINCYSTGGVTGYSSAGGVTGSNSGTVENCVALNPSITRSVLNSSFGRVVGSDSGTLTNNHAWDEMELIDVTPPGSSTTFPSHDDTLTGKDGADLTGANAKAAAANWPVSFQSLP